MFDPGISSLISSIQNDIGYEIATAGVARALHSNPSRERMDLLTLEAKDLDEDLKILAGLRFLPNLQ
jgi:hypothetical protein